MNAPLARATAPLPPSSHYENFPVASWLCPPALRAPVAAIYWFARTADDLADEGEAPAAQRLADLASYRQDLDAVASGKPHSNRWPQVFDALRPALSRHALPRQLLADLLDAFVQDIEKTRDGAGYGSRADLLDYCRRSANPVGRLLLHLYGVQDVRSLRQSDCICSALQLINFWQDLSVDLPRGRFYVPADDAGPFGLDPLKLTAGEDSEALRQLVAHEVRWARALMEEGASLVHSLPGRAGWELRAVVQGGLRILDHIEAAGFTTAMQRPTLRRRDAPVLLWRMLRM